MRNKEHTDRVFRETARRLGMDFDEFMHRPIIEIIKLMIDKDVSMGPQIVK